MPEGSFSVVNIAANALHGGLQLYELTSYNFLRNREIFVAC